MNEKHGRVPRFAKVLELIVIGVAGAAVVYGGIRYSFLNWVVDVPGWIVSRFLPIDFHEGEGAAGFFASLVLSWLLASAAIWIVVVTVRRIVDNHDA